MRKLAEHLDASFRDHWRWWAFGVLLGSFSIAFIETAVGHALAGHISGIAMP